MPAPPTTTPGDRRGWIPWLALGAVLLVVSGIRLRLLDLPLERDEGEYAYVGQLMLQGIPPYELAYNMKWPGTYAAYAAIMSVLGETASGIHLGLVFVTIATAVLTFLLARRICGDVGAVVAAGTYALLAISPPTLGIAAHATHFVVLPALAGVLLLRDVDARTPLWRIVAGGLSIGAAVLAKQAGAVFGVFAALWLVWRDVQRGGTRWSRLAARLGALAIGGVLPFAITCALLAQAGVFDRFWRWTVDYAAAYASIVPLSVGMQSLGKEIVSLFSAAPILWLSGIAGLGLLWLAPAMKPWRAFVSGFAVFSFLAVCPSLNFRGHYFLLLLPAVGLLAGVTVAALAELLERAGTKVSVTMVASVVFGLGAAQSLYASRDVFFELTPNRASRALYGVNPFPESVEIARFIDRNCPPGSKIAVIGSEPQIYFYSRRHSATGYIYTYPLMEPQPYATTMQDEMIREIEAANPRYVVFVSVATSWLRRPDSHRRIFEWFTEYQKRLRLAGTVEILSNDETRYRLPHDGSALRPQTSSWVAVFENPSGT